MALIEPHPRGEIAWSAPLSGELKRGLGRVTKNLHMVNEMMWTVIYVERGSVEIKSRCCTGPMDSEKMWEHAIGLVDDGWVLACVKGTHEPMMGRLPLGRGDIKWLRDSESKSSDDSWEIA